LCSVVSNPAFVLLRRRTQRPRGRRAAEQRDEIASSCIRSSVPSQNLGRGNLEISGAFAAEIERFFYR
jgi:hypothetical protein